MENCTKFGQLTLSKIIKIVATSCQILRLKCIKFDFGWGSAAPQAPYFACIRDPACIQDPAFIRDPATTRGFTVHEQSASWYLTTVWVKENPPCGFLTFFPKLMAIFNQFFINLLHVPFYTRLEIFIQFSPTLTMLCHTKRDHPTDFYISLEV